jgi:RNA polymerase sigma-70 factor (ECF subfamily)
MTRARLGGDAPAGDDEDGRRIAGLLRGDEEPIAELKRWVRGAVGPYRSRLAAEIDDIEQEVALELIESLRAGRFERRSLLATYVRRMVHHKCLNRLRASRGRHWIDPDEVELVDPEPSPFERARRRSDLDLALRVLAEMPESCRELWAMIHRGLGYDAMSERLGIAAGTLRVRVLRCREKAVATRDRMAMGNAAAVAET